MAHPMIKINGFSPLHCPTLEKDACGWTGYADCQLPMLSISPIRSFTVMVIKLCREMLHVRKKGPKCSTIYSCQQQFFENETSILLKIRQHQLLKCFTCGIGLHFGPFFSPCSISQLCPQYDQVLFGIPSLSMKTSLSVSHSAKSKSPFILI